MMKKLLLAFSALISAAVLQAEPLDHWDLGSGTMTDGEWTFNINRRDGDGVLPGSEDIYGLQILACTAFPDHLATLDFSKPVVYTGGDRKYAITQIKPYGDCLSTGAKAVLEHLRLPNHGLGVKLNDTFKECVNLVSVAPFLSADCKVSGQCFSGCVKLSSPLVVVGRNWENTTQNIFRGTAIPSVDMTESPIEALDRGVFANNPALTTVKLSASLTSLQGVEGPFAACTALNSVEFRSVPTGLNNGFRNSNQPSWPLCNALSAVHFYNCAPTASPSATVYEKVATGKALTTYLHDMSDEQLAAWGEYCAEDGKISDFSTWKKSLVGNAVYQLRPILVYSIKHVSLAAGQDGGVIAGRPGTFILSRAEDDAVGGSVLVNYTIVGGTAEEGVHFKPLSGVAEIPAGEKRGVLEVSPMYFGYIGTETLKLKLAAGDYEIVEGEDEASISLSTEALRSVSIAKGEDADEGAGKVGYFVLSRGEGDSIEGPVDVVLSFGGTAVAGQTYRPIKNIVTIPAGEKTLKVKVVPYDDPSVTEDKTVEATILPGGYGIGTDSATVTIANGETYGGWKFVDGTHISDGKWTFTVSRRPDPADSFEDGTRHLWVQTCTAWPSEVSTLDFGKAFHNFYDSTYYMIRKFENAFSGKEEAAAVLGSLVLPDDYEHKFEILSGCFKGCPNLTSVTPFLPKTCELLGQNAFGFLPNLVQKDLYFYGSDFGSAVGCWGIIEGCTGITNVDLSASTITVLRRDCFKNCTGLKVVTLPPTIQEFGAPHGDNLGLQNRTPFEGVGGVKVIFTGGMLPEMTYQDGNVAAIEFTTPVAELPDNAFANYYSMYSSPRLSSITFAGPPPATIGNDLFTGGYKGKAITINVPNYYIADWRKIADNGVLTKKDGGTWTSGTTQLLATYGESRQGLMVIVR